jgi:hypothetical protein
MPREKEKIVREYPIYKRMHHGKDRWVEWYTPQRGRHSKLKKILDSFCILIREGFSKEDFKMLKDNKFTEVSVILRLTKYKGSRKREKKPKRMLRPIEN